MKNKWIEMMKKMKAVCFAAGLGFLTVAGSVCAAKDAYAAENTGALVCDSGEEKTESEESEGTNSEGGIRPYGEQGTTGMIEY